MRTHTLRGLLAAFAASAAAVAQPVSTSPLSPPYNGPRTADPTWHALTNATVHVKPGQTLEHATLVIRDGRIVSIEAASAAEPGPGGDGAAPASPAAPAGARVWDCTGLHIYPGFIDAYVEVEAPKPAAGAPGIHWNPKVTPERSALDGTGLDAETAEALRKMGFAAAAISPREGIFRGRAAVVSLASPEENPAADKPLVYAENVYHAMAFETAGGRGGGSTPGPNWSGYPDSRMGSIALIRQTLLDADWNSSGGPVEAGSATALDFLRRNMARNEPYGAFVADASVDAFQAATVPMLFDAADELQAIRAAMLAREFERPAIVLGSGNEFKRLDAIVKDGLPFVLPLQFPRDPDLGTPGAIDATDLGTLMEWEQAPTNPRRLDAAGVPVALTTSKLRSRADFTRNLQKAIDHGLAPDRALAMLTTIPADLLHVNDRLGTLEAGKAASLIVTDGALFETTKARKARVKAAKEAKQKVTEAASIHDVWIDGKRHEIKPRPEPEIGGVWKALLAGQFELSLEIADGPAVTVREGETKQKATGVKHERGQLSFVFEHKPFGPPGRFVMTGTVQGERMTGTGMRADGQVFQWSAQRTGPLPEPEKKAEGEGEKKEEAAPGADPAAAKPDGTPEPAKPVEAGAPGAEPPPGSGAAQPAEGAGEAAAGDKDAKKDEKEDSKEEDFDATADIPEQLGLPFGPYMMMEPPAQKTYIYRNATIWTCGPEGVIENGTLVISGGKVEYVGGGDGAGRTRSGDSVVEIDATGKHITPGIIDCHSHTGLFAGGVNEGGQAVSAEVRIHDSLDPGAINFYRQLAAGVTAMNSLHGSANAIGGQNAVHKVRWGAARPSDMLLEGAKPGIKFALGENPRAVNWGPQMTWRYPQTRMGVETIIRDRFTAAREYAAQWADWESGGKKGTPPRRDLELEAVAEILAGERLIHCHSYRQDEILMLCKMSEEFGFRIGTFQHVLEGYKVAEAIKARAIGGSAFSDWWNYKAEVQDAIPYAGAIMHEQGVVVSFNSDSDELARRMNVEAGKAVKYGGVKPEEALKFVTLNAAKQLMIDNRTGSLEAGKDADVAVWSGPPMSTLSRCEATYVDGREYFSLAQDAAHRERIAKERERLVQKALRVAAGGGGDRSGGGEGGPGGGRRPGGRPTEAEEEDARAEYYRAYIRQHYLDQLNRGRNPEFGQCGDCGCWVLGVQ